MTAWARPWLAWLDERCRCEVSRLRARYALTADELRGLYTSDEQVDHLLQPSQLPAHHGVDEAALAAAVESLRHGALGEIADRLALTPTDIRTLFVALAPELDVRYASIYAYLNDDVTRRLPTIDLCMRLAGVEPATFDAAAPLVRRGVLAIHPPADSGPWRMSEVSVGDGVRMFALGARRELQLTEPMSDYDALARRVDNPATWSDLALPAQTHDELHELASAVRDRQLVFRTWGADRHGSEPVSLRVLFAGPPGTGKTLAASAIANSAGLDLLVVDLSALVSKYIGETEKNLERVFAAAARLGSILFFDEADALFGKRSEVRESHDRFANIQVAYLLQRMEQHEGVMILATNLTHNLDDAFRRRLHFSIDFPLPDERCRAELWRLHIPPRAPLAGDIDVPFLAAQFALAGGDIRNAMLTAAFLAAHEQQPLSMQHVIRAVARQRRAQGKIPTAAEFRQHLATIR